MFEGAGGRTATPTLVEVRRNINGLEIYSALVNLGRIMAKAKSKRSAVDRAAQVVGRAVGSVADTIESFQAEHPHPVEEAREVVSTGQEVLSAAAANAGAQAAAIVKKVKAVARRTKKAVTRARTKSKLGTLRVTRTVKKIVKRARKAATSARKTVRPAAKRAKKR